MTIYFLHLHSLGEGVEEAIQPQRTIAFATQQARKDAIGVFNKLIRELQQNKNTSYLFLRTSEFEETDTVHTSGMDGVLDVLLNQDINGYEGWEGIISYNEFNNNQHPEDQLDLLQTIHNIINR